MALEEEQAIRAAASAMALEEAQARSTGLGRRPMRAEILLRYESDTAEILIRYFTRPKAAMRYMKLLAKGRDATPDQRP